MNINYKLLLSAIILAASAMSIFSTQDSDSETDSEMDSEFRASQKDGFTFHRDGLDQSQLNLLEAYANGLQGREKSQSKAQEKAETGMVAEITKIVAISAASGMAASACGGSPIAGAVGAMVAKKYIDGSTPQKMANAVGQKCCSTASKTKQFAEKNPGKSLAIVAVAGLAAAAVYYKKDAIAGALGYGDTIESLQEAIELLEVQLELSTKIDDKRKIEAQLKDLREKLEILKGDVEVEI